MSIHDVQFPPDISYGASGGPNYSTGIVTTQSKGEKRNQNWEKGWCSYNVAHGVKRQEQLDRLIAFFRARKGKAYGFRFKDWADYKGTTQVCAATEIPGIYQLYKTYIDDAGYTESRKITRPVLGTVKVYGDAVELTTGVTVDYATGKITVIVDPMPAVITADFEFDVPCRFDTDEMPVSIDSFNNYSWNSIPVVEIRD